MSTLSVDTLQGQTTAANLKLPAGYVVQTVHMQGHGNGTQSSTSSSYVEISTALRTTITPKYANSKIMFFCTLGMGIEKNGSHDSTGGYKLYDVTAGADVPNTVSAIRHYDYGGSGQYTQHVVSFNVLLDSWGTTAKTFTPYFACITGDRVRCGDENDSTSITIMEIAQ